MCVAGHIARTWRESGPWVSGKGAFGVGSVGQLWSKLGAGPAAVQRQPAWMSDSTVQALCSSSSVRRIPGCHLQFHVRALKQRKWACSVLEAMKEFLFYKRVLSALTGPLYLRLTNLESRRFLLSASGSRAEYKEGCLSLMLLSVRRAQNQPASLLWLRVFLRKRPKGRKMPSKLQLLPLWGLSIQHQ